MEKKKRIKINFGFKDCKIETVNNVLYIIYKDEIVCQITGVKNLKDSNILGLIKCMIESKYVYLKVSYKYLTTVFENEVKSTFTLVNKTTETIKTDVEKIKPMVKTKVKIVKKWVARIMFAYQIDMSYYKPIGNLRFNLDFRRR